MACTSDHSDYMLRSRIEDTVRLCDKRGVPCFLGFLDLREQAYAQQILRTIHADVIISFYGGYSEAEEGKVTSGQGCAQAAEARADYFPGRRTRRVRFSFFLA